jgi:hypothetical protein
MDDRPLDAVDSCCRLHDLNHFDMGRLGALSPINACGFVMCLRQATGTPADVTDLLPEVERARQGMFRHAAILCGIPSTALPPPTPQP